MPDNILGNETPPRLMNDEELSWFANHAERLNGQLAMLGIVAGIGAYATTGQLIPGIF